MKIRNILCLVLATVLLAGCQLRGDAADIPDYTFSEEGGYATIRFAPVELKIESGYLEKAERNYAAQQTESGVQAATSFLSGRELKTADVILHAGDGATMVYEGQADIYYAEARDIPFTSLVTQVMSGVDGVPDWLREGVGAYVADINKESMLTTQGHMIEVLNRYVEQQAENEESGADAYYTIDVLAGVLYRESAYQEAAELGDMAAAIASIGYAQEAYNFRGAYCIYAGSFVKYLDQTYGREPILRLYEGEDFREVVGADFETVRAAWLESL